MTKNNIIHIHNNIFLGTYLNSICIDKVKESNINCIIFIGHVNKSKYTLDEYSDNNIDHYFIKIGKNNDFLDDILTKSMKLIEINLRKNILVQCAKGFSLSIYVIIFYYMTILKKKENFRENTFITINLINFIYLKNNRISVSDHCIKSLLQKEQQLIKYKKETNYVIF
jgi:hypothetical protein